MIAIGITAEALPFGRVVVLPGGARAGSILKEDGFVLLLESGDKLLKD